jgi:enamine deaminase RidA (YjgF/YER057c/UK114 family)
MSIVKITVSERHGRRCASSGSKWEPVMGYSRAVRSGNVIAVTGTVGIEADGSYAKTVGEQTARSLTIIRAAIEALGGKMEQVIRTRMYVVDVSQWEQIARVHGQVFGEIRPATTIVEVARLIDDAALIEIEADAMVM